MGFLMGEAEMLQWGKAEVAAMRLLRVVEGAMKLPSVVVGK